MSTFHYLFIRFKLGRFSFEDNEKPDRACKVDKSVVVEAIRLNPHLSSREISTDLNIFQSFVIRTLRVENFKNSFDKWIPHDFLSKAKIDVLSHPPYSLDLSPSDYHLFRFLQHHLAGNNFKTRDDVLYSLNSYFVSKPAEFWQRGIDANGNYFD